MTYSFQEPQYLWLLVLLPLLFFPWKRTGFWQVLLRAITCSLLIAALAKPLLLRQSEMSTHVFVLDRSASLLDSDRLAAARALTRLREAHEGNDTLVLLTSGDDPGQELTQGFDRHVHLGSNEGGVRGLGSALQAALRAIPEGEPGAVTLIGDGLSTEKRWGPAFQELVERGLPLHVIPLRADVSGAQVVDLEVLDEMRIGQIVRVQVSLDRAQEGARLSLLLNDEEVAGTPVRADDVDVRLAFEPDTSGFAKLEARLEHSDETVSSLTRTVAIQDPLRILYLGSRIRSSSQKMTELLGPGFALDAASSNGGGQAPNFKAYDGIVIDDLPAERLPVSWQEGVAQAVHEGGVGLLLSGGRAAFGPGGYHKTIIESIAPVEFMQKEEKKDPSTTLAIIIDTSGSMVGNRMTIAKEVARLAMRRLEPHDKIGIVEFYGTKQWAAPIQSAANAIDLQRAINRLGAEGGTVLFPAVEEAYYALKNVETRFKHVMVLTDAGVETGPYETLLRKMSDDGITVSTVLVGPGRHSEFLVEMADWGGGRYYHAPDRFNLPELMLKKPNTSALPAYRPGVVEIESQGRSRWTGDGNAEAQVPPLSGYVESKPRPSAEVVLATKGTQKPVLASWHHGLGRVTTLMTEPTGPGTKTWQDWPRFGAFAARVLTKTAAFHQGPFEFRMERRDWRLTVTAKQLIPGELNPVCNVSETALEEVTASSSGTTMREKAFTRVGPDLFECHFALSPHATQEMVVSCKELPEYFARLVSDPLDHVSPELQVDPREAFDLSRASEATQGSVLTLATLQSLPEARGGEATRALELWSYLILAALLLFLLEILLRRLPGRAAA